MRFRPTSADRSQERHERHVELGAASAAIRRSTPRRRPAPPAASATCIVSRVEPPVVDDVFDDEHAFAGSDREAAAQHEAAVLPLGEHRAHAERAPDLVADDDAAERRRQHDGRATTRGPSRRAPRPSASAVLRDAAARARTADSRGCAGRTSGGSGLRAARPIAGRARAPGRDRVLSSFFHGKGAARAPGRSKRAVVYNPSVLRKLS